ncbi:hypothetical protein Bca101_016123 [Brassica carinata]
MDVCRITGVMNVPCFLSDLQTKDPHQCSNAPSRSPPGSAMGIETKYETLSMTWEDGVNQLVDDFPWIQTHGTCWAYSLMRHMNAACRIASLIGAESLSVTYLVHYMSVFSTLTDTLGLPSLESVRPFLMFEGMVLDDDYQRLFGQFSRIPALPLPVRCCRYESS